MNPAQLSAFFQAHKPAVLGTSAAAVAGLAVWQRRRAAAGGSSAPARTAGASAAPGTIPAAGVFAGTGYDSTSTDLYNALSPQLEQILKAVGPVTAPAPAKSPLINTKPKPVAPKPVAPKFTEGYYKIAGENRTYFQDAAGTLDWLSKAEGDALQVRAGQKNASKVKVISGDATFWDNRTYLGVGAPKQAQGVKKPGTK